VASLQPDRRGGGQAQDRRARLVLRRLRRDARHGRATLLLQAFGDQPRLGSQWNKVDLPQGSFREDVYSARLQINVSSDLQISSLLQYDNQSRSFGTNTRLRWTFNPLGDVFVVYNHNLDRSLDDRWLFNSNQLLVKIQYAFRL
jgi:hypothetical protein